MKLNKNEISKKIIELTRLITSDSLKHIPSYQLNEITKRRKTYKKFRYHLFKNWKKAQREILQIQLNFWESGVDFKEKRNLVYLYRSTQRLLDCIIWHHFGPDITDMKRIYNFEKSMVDLRNHNIDTHIKVMEEINECNNSFALISDLTSGVRLGDIFKVNDDGCQFIEVKSGKVNEDILKALHGGTDKDVEILVTNPKMEKQTERMLRQADRTLNALKSLNNEDSVDDRFKGAKGVSVILDNTSVQDFSVDLKDFLRTFSSKEKDIDTLEIDSCLLIISYKNSQKGIEQADKQIEDYDKSEGLIGVRYSWFEALHETNIFKPIFLQPISSEAIDQIVSGEIVVVFYFSFSKFMRNMKNEKVEIVFRKDKRFQRDYSSLKAHGGKSQFYEANKGSLYFIFKEINNKEMILSEGLFCRIISSLVKPSHLIYLHHLLAKWDR